MLVCEGLKEYGPKPRPQAWMSATRVVSQEQG